MLMSDPKPYYRNMLENSFGINDIGYDVRKIGENEYSHENGKEFLQILIDEMKR